MATSTTYAVFGLGRYGTAVAKELLNGGAEVLAVDIDETIVNSKVNELPYCKCADITNAEVIKQLGISNIDVVIICMGNFLEACIISTVLCKEAGVKKIIAKCSNETQKKILKSVGADITVIPEQESGTRLAKNLLSSGFVDIVELSKDFSMVELDVLPEWHNKTVLELNLRKKYDINVVAIRKENEINVTIKPETVLTSDMQLIVIANTAKLDKFMK